VNDSLLIFPILNLLNPAYIRFLHT